MNSEGQNSEKSLNELFEQLATLKRELAGIGEDVVVTLEQKWAQFHSVLFPQVVSYCENWGVLRASVFQVHSGHLLPLPVLSLKTPELPAKMSLIHDMSVIEEAFGENASQMLHRAMASREMEFDFDCGLTCAPFCLFDGVVGLFFFQFRELTEDSYGALTSATERFFDKIRREILVGRISELKKSSQRAG